MRRAGSEEAERLVELRWEQESAAPLVADGLDTIDLAFSLQASTLPRMNLLLLSAEMISSKFAKTVTKKRKKSACSARNGPLRSRILENVIGRNRTGIDGGIRSFCRLRRVQFVLAMLHKPASEHGRRVFFKPLIEKRRHLLAQIGGMAKPRKFVTLQTGFRSRQQELPRGLNPLAVHRAPFGIEEAD